MSARADIAAHFTSDTLADQLLDAHRAENLVEGAVALERIADETEARVAAHYGAGSGIGPGSAELVREAARTLRSMAGETATAPVASDSSREQRLEQLLDTIRTHGGRWTTLRVQDVRRRAQGATQRGTARRDLAELHRRGHLTVRGPADGRSYTLARREDRDA